MPQKYLECQVCGAVLAPEDAFCGECGEPVPGAAETEPPEAEQGLEPAARPEPVTPSAVEPQPAPPPAPPAAGGPRLGRKGWVIGMSVAGIAGILLCLVGLAVWALVAFSPPAEGMTEAEDFTLATLCCGLPLVGPAIVLVVIAAAIWYVRVRNGQ